MLGGSGLPPLDLSALLQFVFTALALASGLLFLVKYAASKYFDVDANFAVDSCYEVRERKMSVGRGDDEKCFVCGRPGTKKCSRCKNVRYCSSECQAKHWKEHKLKCKDSKMSNDIASVPSSNITSSNSVCRRRNAFSPAIALVPARGSCKELKQPKKILFPYEEFVKLFNWNKQTFPPCGLLNCGNSCFANVVLQCLSCTRPLVAYLLEEGHSRECSRRDWCFLCELQIHIKKVSQSLQPFSPISILSRLPNIGGNLGYGRQEDAHEFMRFAIDTMQSICLDEYGGEKALDPRTHETTLIHHIFGGLLQSQIICTECNVISNRYENMMDLTVEIQGDAKSLEECLDQFTVKEWLDGENMYRCDGCNDYVKAWKRLTVHQAPNILTIALKRFQSGRFGKLNKRVTFPEILDLGPYMSGAGDGTDVYTLYAVVVHVDMLNASFFGHYICYTKDFLGHWYKIDDCKVMEIEVGEVLAQGAYMLFYSRMSAHQLFVRSLEPIRNHGKQSVQIVSELKRELSSRIDSELKKEEPNDMDLDEPSIIKLGSLTHGKQSVQIVSELKRELSSRIDSELKKEEPEDMDLDEPSIINLGSLAQDSGDADMDFSDTRCLGPKYIDGNTIDLLSYKVPHSESHTAGCQRPCFRSHGDLQFEIEIGSSSNSEELLKVADSRDSGALNTAFEPLEANPSLSDCYCGPEAEHADSANEIVMLAPAVRNHETKALESNKESTAHRAESKPVFSPSSLNKPNIKKSLHHEGRAGLGNGEAVLFSRYNGECNGFLESDNNWDGKSKSSSAASSSTIEGCRVSIPGVSSVAELLEANPPLPHYSSGIKLEKTNAVSGGPSYSANGVSRLGGMLPVARNHETKSPLSSCSDNTTYKGGSKPLLSPGLLDKCVKKTQMQRSGLSSWDRNRPNGVLEYDNCSYVGEVNPQFSPGFLVKQGGNKSLDQEEKFHTENGLGLSCKENGKCNGYVVSKLARQKVQNHEANRDSFCGSDKDTVPDCQLPLISCGFLDKSNGKARKDETSKQDADKNGFESRTNCDGFTDPTFLV